MNRESFSNGNPQYAAIPHIGNISPVKLKNFLLSK